MFTKNDFSEYAIVSKSDVQDADVETPIASHAKANGVETTN